MNDTAVTAGQAVDFCNVCSDGPFYVIVGSFPPGASGLLTNTFTATTTRYISLAYDFSTPLGVKEIYSYVHIPAASSVSGRNYYQNIPQGIDSLNNLTAQNFNTTDCGITPNIVLPIGVTLFNGNYRDNYVHLSWNVDAAAQLNSFDVQSSADGVAFNTIANVRAQANASDNAGYFYNDLNPPVNKAFYRLKMLDVNGMFSYSSVLQLSTLLLQQPISISPNPADNVIDVSLLSSSAGDAYFFISNASGTIVEQGRQTIKTGENKIVLSIGNMASGIYFLRTETNGMVENKMFVKK